MRSHTFFVSTTSLPDTQRDIVNKQVSQAIA